MNALAELWPQLSVPVAGLLVLGWYLSYSAARLDRLHHRVESARAALQTQLARRAAAAIEAAPVLDPASALLVAAAGAQALAAQPTDPTPRAPAVAEAVPVAVDEAVDEEAENDLTRALLDTLSDPDEVAGFRDAVLAADLLDALTGACVRVQLARRFHNDAVAQAQRVRRKRVVRWARLAGRAQWPQMIEIDDTVPPGLARTASQPPVQG